MALTSYVYSAHLLCNVEQHRRKLIRQWEPKRRIGRSAVESKREHIPKEAGHELSVGCCQPHVKAHHDARHDCDLGNAVGDMCNVMSGVVDSVTASVWP